MGSPLYTVVKGGKCGMAPKRRKKTTEGKNKAVCRKSPFESLFGITMILFSFIFSRTADTQCTILLSTNG